MKNKIICLLLAVIMCLTCLAGCVGGGGDTTGDGGSTEGDTGNTGNNNPGNNNTGNNNNGNNDNTGTTDNWWDDIEYDTTDILFMMTKCTNSQELPSGCERYLAGEGNYKEDIDTLVEQRNSDAYANTKVNVTYKYYPDIVGEDGYGYARAQLHMVAEMEDPTVNTPDIYCNWMTDMLLCSLKGCFANLYTRKAEYGKNYFDINLQEGKNYNGYMAELMGSLTLSSQKIYVIASDYFIDLIRAFFIVPVNVSLFNEAATKVGQYGDALTDLYPDGVVDINDLFVEVEQGNWTYQRLIQYTQAIYKEAGSNTSGSDAMSDEKLGFALGRNGLAAAGMVYTSSAVIINKDPVTGGGYEYTYGDKKASPQDPDTNERLAAIMAAISSMMDVNGVIVATKDDASNLGLQGDEVTELLGVRKKFTSNELLFGGIILAGSLEFDAYQNMKKNGGKGFGVVPVPVYMKGDAYKTQIHVVGRAGAVRATTTKFSACSAFLQYQSQNSTEILNHYYEYKLVHGAAAGLEGNETMLKFLRKEENIRTTFDKLFEDAIGFMYTETPVNESDRYHTLLWSNDYKFDTFATEYERLVGVKQGNLKNLVDSYDSLPE